MAGNALELARHGVPREPLYLTGQVGGKPVSIHAEGERVILTGPQGTRQEIDLAARPAATAVTGTDLATAPERGTEPTALPAPICPAGAVGSALDEDAEPAPGTSPLDAGLERIAEAFGSPGGEP